MLNSLIAIGIIVFAGCVLLLFLFDTSDKEKTKMLFLIGYGSLIVVLLTFWFFSYKDIIISNL